ncbi:cytochrome c551 [Halobacillus sp. BBL2006]|uniref:cytochrome c551 n=1 Tax=Halobacillus sp. BBL2006 TaxID=1543706 RepID=UPI000541B146|nr:cytochrome c [Halobacillus sp. BBL2006]KHE69388.1 cytochrome C551 [Halobacillus sp. BBL2006]
MKKLLSALFLGLILVLAACGGGEDEGATDDNATEQTDEGTNENADSGEGTVDAEAAEQAFQKNCASCHGGDLGGGMGPSLQEVGSKYSAEDIVGIIHNGKGSMPAQGQVSDEDAELIAGWLATKK